MVPAQPLRTCLPDMQRIADSPYRRNAVNRQVIREHDCCALPERIGCVVTVVMNLKSRDTDQLSEPA